MEDKAMEQNDTKMKNSKAYQAKERRIMRLGAICLVLWLFDILSRKIYPELMQNPFIFWPFLLVISILTGCCLFHATCLYLTDKSDRKFSFKRGANNKRTEPSLFLLVFLVYSASSMVITNGMALVAYTTTQPFLLQGQATDFLYYWQNADSPKTYQLAADILHKTYDIHVPVGDGNGKYTDNPNRQSNAAQSNSLEIWQLALSEHEKAFDMASNNAAVAWWFTAFFSIAFVTSLGLSFGQYKRATNRVKLSRYFWLGSALCLTAVVTMFVNPSGMSSDRILAIAVLAVFLPVAMIYLLVCFIQGKTSRPVLFTLNIAVIAIHFTTVYNLSEENFRNAVHLKYQELTYQTVNRELNRLINGESQEDRKNGARNLYVEFGVELDYPIDNGAYTRFKPSTDDVKDYRWNVKFKLQKQHHKEMARTKAKPLKYLCLGYFLIFVMSFGVAVIYAKQQIRKEDNIENN